MFERFTTAARAAVRQARREARELGHPWIGTEHLLLALLAPPPREPVSGQAPGRAGELLTLAGLRYDQVRADVVRWGRPSGPYAEYPGLNAEDAAALEAIGIDLDAVRARLEDAFGPGVLEATPPAERRGLFRRAESERSRDRFSRRGRKALALALREAIRLKQPYIGTEHLLLGILRDGSGPAVQLMKDAGVDLARLRTEAEVATAAAA